MSTVQQVWNWNNFSWWEWDAFFYWPAGWYRVSSQLETRMVENSIRISQKKTDTWLTYVWSILAVNPYADRCFTTRDWNIWKIYLNWTFQLDLSTWTWSWDRIIWFWKMQKSSSNIVYSYWITQASNWTGKIHRINTDAFQIDYSVWTYILSNSRTTNWTSLPVISKSDRIIFANWNTIFEFDSNEVLTTKVSLPIDYDIIAITEYQDTYKVFYNVPKYSSGNKDWYIAYWDWLSTDFQQIVSYENSPIITAINDWAYDYAVFWNNITSDLYYVGWLSRWQPLRVNTENSVNVNGRIFGRRWFVREWMLYITGNDKLTNNCIYTYGSYYPGTPKSLVSTQNLVTSYNNVWLNAWEQIYYIYDNNKIWTQEFSFWVSSNEQWVCISYPITWKIWGFTEKTIDRIDIWYDLMWNANTIKIYARKNARTDTLNTDWWTLLRTISDNTKKFVRVEKNELLSLELWDFNTLEFKVELNKNSLATFSPEFRNLRLLYKDNLKD